MCAQGALASFRWSAGVIPPEPAVPCSGPGPPGLSGGCRAVGGLSASNLLQGPQGCLQGHVHTVADVFGVVWHWVASALVGSGKWALMLVRRKFITMPPGSPAQAPGTTLPTVGSPGAQLLCPRHLTRWLAILEHEAEGASLPLESSPFST